MLARMMIAKDLAPNTCLEIDVEDDDLVIRENPGK